MKIFMLVLVLCMTSFSGVYDIKVLNDNQPDYSNAESFTNSIFESYTNYNDKAIALWRWVCHSRFQGNLSDDEFNNNSRDPNGTNLRSDQKDLMTHMNSITNQNCGVVNPAIGNMWNFVTGLSYHQFAGGAPHTLAEFQYDGKYHYIDASLDVVVPDTNGILAGRTEFKNEYLSTNPNKFYYKTFLNRRGDDSLCLVGNQGANTDYQVTYAKYSALGDNADQTDVSSGRCSDQYILHMRPYEYYKRYKNPIDTNSDYYIGNTNPNDTWKNNSSNTNGEWVLQPDFSKSDWFETVYDTSNISQNGSALSPRAAGKTAFVTFYISAYNAITSIDIDAVLTKTAADSAEMFYTTDVGRDKASQRWISLGLMNGGAFTAHLDATVKSKRFYLVKVVMNAATTPSSVQLASLKIRTITQVNRKTFFQLAKGTNKVYVKLGDTQLEHLEYRTNVYADSANKYALNYIYGSNNISFVNNWWYCPLFPTANGIGYVTFKLEAPGDIKKISAAGVFLRANANEPIKFYYSTDGGATWTAFGGEVPLGTGFYNSVADMYSKLAVRGSYRANGDITTSTKSVLIKVEITRASGNANHNGIININFSADYVPPASTARELELSFGWTEYRNSGRVTRSYVKHINTSTTGWTSFEVNVQGERQPFMRYVTLNCVGFNPDGNGTPEGYSDGDIGTTAAKSKFVIVKSNRLSTGAAVSVSVAAMIPLNGTGAPPTSWLTDEIVADWRSGWSSYTSAMTHFIQWAAGKNPVITVDLGSVQTMQGVTIVQARSRGDYADSILVHTSANGTTWDYQGKISYYDAFNWEGDYVREHTWEKIKDSTFNCTGLGGYDFPLIFTANVNAQYVQFSIYNPYITSIWETRVWGSMKKVAWNHELFQHDQLTGVMPVPLALYTGGVKNGIYCNVFPNPFASSVVITALAGDKIKDLNIYDIQGKLVYSVSRSNAGTALTSTEVWNGTDRFGRPVANGNYFVKVNTLKGQALPKVNLAR